MLLNISAALLFDCGLQNADCGFMLASMSEQENARFPKNVPGPFYVENDMCITCGAPEAAAPDLIGFDEAANHCYFKKQPSTPEEYERAMQAVWVSCCGAVQYSSDDPVVLRQINKINDKQNPIKYFLRQIFLRQENEKPQEKAWWKFW